MSTAITEIDRRAFRHDVVDGLSEIAMAFFFLVPAFTVRQPAFSWMIILPILLMGPWLRKLRARHTWPRIGYVEPRGENAGQMLKGMAIYVAAVTVVVGAGLFIFRGEIKPGLIRQVSPLLASLLFGGGLLYAAGRSGLKRYHALLALSLTLGATLTFMQIPGRYLSLQIYLLGMGAITFVVGTVTFIHFIRTHPIRNLEEDDHAE
jgi:hypothetical protein